MFRSFLKPLFRLCLVGVLFFIILRVFLYASIYLGVGDLFYGRPSDLSRSVEEYRKEHGFPPSLLAVSKELDRQYGSYYFIVPRWEQKWKPSGLWLVKRKPIRMLMPFPFGVMGYYYTFDVRDKNLLIQRTFSDWKTRNLCAWAAKQSNLTEQRVPEYNLALSFVPDVVFYLVLILFTILFIKRAKRVDKKENDLLRSLEGRYQGILMFQQNNGRQPESEEEFLTAGRSDGANFDLEKSFQFLGGFHMKYDGLTIVASSVKAWRAPLSPLFGGKRAFILLENGRIIKLKGASAVEGFYSRVKVAKKYFLKVTNAPIDKRNVLGAVPPKIQKVLDIPRGSALVDGARAFGFSLLSGIIVFGFFAWTFLFFSDSGCDFDFTLFSFIIAYFTMGVIPYWIVASNWFAEY